MAITRSLSVPNFRRYFWGGVVSNLGTWMLRTGQSWLVLDLGHASGAALGIVTMLQFGPTLVFSVWAGSLSDRHDKATILAITQSLIAVSSIALAVLDLAGVLNLPLVYAIALLAGTFTAFDAPVRQAFATELVGADHVVNAVGLNSASFNGARLAGPILAALALSFSGTWLVFLVAGLSGAAIVLSLVRIDRSALCRRVGGKPDRVWSAGFVTVGRSPLLVCFVALAMLGNAVGSNSLQVVLPIIATRVFSGDALGFGVLTAALALGGLCGALAASSTSGVPRVRRVLYAAAAFALASLVASFMPTYAAFAAALVGVGFFYMAFVVMVNTVTQLAAPPAVRGRVVSVYIMFFLGGGALGSPLLGVLSDGVGPMRAMTVSGAAMGVSALAAAGVLVVAARRRPLGAAHDAAARPPVPTSAAPAAPPLSVREPATSVASTKPRP